MKLNNDSGNLGLNVLFTYNYGMNVNYGADEVREYLVFIDQLDFDLAEEMLAYR